MSPDELMGEYEAALVSHDLERTLDLIHPDAVYWFSDGTAHVGIEAIRAAIGQNFEAIKDESYRIENLSWVSRSPESAACTFRFSWSGKLDGAPASGEGRGTAVLVRREDSWVIVHEHLCRG